MAILNNPALGKLDILLLHRRNLDAASEADHVQWAVDAMVAGVDSRSLRLLAGLMPPYDPIEVLGYFEKALEELEIEHPSEEESIDLFAQWIAAGILVGVVDARYGLRQLHRLGEWRDWPEAYLILYWLPLEIRMVELGYSSINYPGLRKEDFERVAEEHAREFLELLRDTDQAH